MTTASVERYNDEPTVKPLSHSERYGPAMAKVGYNVEAAQKEAIQNIKDAAKISPLAKLNELLRTGDHTKKTDARSSEQVDLLRKAIDKIGGKKSPKKLKN
ncbi:MAG: hypothetical protein KGH65_05415 [Candidatus Micrarchaeota archaeon]|nr:hypothetical protein [Candidatus Micrarchaeota archaeon]